MQPLSTLRQRGTHATDSIGDDGTQSVGVFAKYREASITSTDSVCPHHRSHNHV